MFQGLETGNTKVVGSTVCSVECCDRETAEKSTGCANRCTFNFISFSARTNQYCIGSTAQTCWEGRVSNDGLTNPLCSFR